MNSMTSIQDFMSQYNSYTSDAFHYLQNVSNSSPSLSQSLFSSEGRPVNVTPVAVSVLAGILIGMLLMWTILKKQNKNPAREESV